MTDTSDSKKFVAPLDGTEHGYIGHSPGAEDDLTVTGQVGGTANVADTPKSAETKTTGRKGTTSGS